MDKANQNKAEGPGQDISRSVSSRIRPGSNRARGRSVFESTSGTCRPVTSVASVRWRALKR